MSYKEDYIDENSDEKDIIEENPEVEKSFEKNEKEMLPKKKPISNLKKLGNAKFRWIYSRLKNGKIVQ